MTSLGLTEEELDSLLNPKNTHELAKILLKIPSFEMINLGRDGNQFEIYDGYKCVVHGMIVNDCD